MEVFGVWLVMAIVTAVVAHSRGRSAGLWFLIGFGLSIVGLILVALLPPVVMVDGVAQEELAISHTKCPDCAELIKREAKVCKHCGKRLVAER